MAATDSTLMEKMGKAVPSQLKSRVDEGVATATMTHFVGPIISIINQNFLKVDSLARCTGQNFIFLSIIAGYLVGAISVWFKELGSTVSREAHSSSVRAQGA